MVYAQSEHYDIPFLGSGPTGTGDYANTIPGRSHRAKKIRLSKST